MHLPQISHKDVAAALRQAATQYADSQGAPLDTVEVLKLGSFSVRCRPCSAAVMAVARKYQRATSPKPQHVRAVARQASTAVATFRAMCEAGDFADAVAFWGLRHTVYFAQTGRGYIPLVDASEFEPGFVVARRPEDLSAWTVTHLDSGRAVLPSSRLGRTRASAVTLFAELARTIRQKLKDHDLGTGTQEAARALYAVGAVTK